MPRATCRRREHADRHKGAHERRTRCAPPGSIVELSRRCDHQQGPQRRHRYLEQGAERLFGYLAEEVVGKPITISFPPDRHDEETGILQRIRRGERVDHFETVRRRKDGNWLKISLTVSPVIDRPVRNRCLQDRARHHRTKAAGGADQSARPRSGPSHQEPVGLGAGHGPSDARRDDRRIQAAIEGRLRALANARAALARSRWTGVDLHDLSLRSFPPIATIATSGHGSKVQA